MHLTDEEKINLEKAPPRFQELVHEHTAIENELKEISSTFSSKTTADEFENICERRKALWERLDKTFSEMLTFKGWLVPLSFEDLGITPPPEVTIQFEVIPEFLAKI